MWDLSSHHQGWNPCSLQWKQSPNPLIYQGSPHQLVF